MAFEYSGDGALDYFPCRYGKSKLLFRGPRRQLTEAYCAALGGGETYGKFVSDPWPKLVEDKLNFPVVNFGYLNAGIDVFLSEPQLTDMTRMTKVSIVQALGAVNLSNRFYAVHPRRNDRFLRASNMMRAVFPEIDFTEFNFTRHLVGALQERAPDRFTAVEAELRTAWVARMTQLLARVGGRKVLFVLGDYRPLGHHDQLGPEPLLITSEMIETLRPLVDAVVRVDPSAMARSAGTVGMAFAPLEEPAAAIMPGPLVHQEIAEALTPVLSGLI